MRSEELGDGNAERAREPFDDIKADVEGGPSFDPRDCGSGDS